MLYKNEAVILPKTYELLNLLQNDPVFDDFILAGGTALALQIGHRHSIDLDFFTDHEFSTENFVNHLSVQYDFFLDNVAQNTLSGVINGIKVDLLKHGYPWIEAPIQDEGLRLASTKDIAAMKVYTIVHSGKRQKDYLDIYFLLELYSLTEILTFFEKKYPNAHKIIGLKSLTWFDDIDFLLDPPMVNKEISFEEVQARILEATETPQKVFKKS